MGPWWFGPTATEGSGLTFGPMAMTLAMCGPGSLSDRYLRALDAVYACRLRDGYLYLSLRTDTGIMKFRPAVKSGQPTLN
ncbi:MAG TPA: META domain-containing protein [Terriglobia bacterium]